MVFTSSSGVRGFVKNNPNEKYFNKVIACIGESTKLQAEALGFKSIIMPENANVETITKCIVDWRHNNA
jgi:uroporphyrinogen-III synthase